MAKYIIEVPDTTQWIQWMNVSEKDGSACFDYKAPEDLTPYVRSESYIDGLKKGQNDAWKFVVKCLKMDGSDFYKIFDSCDVLCLTNLSYQEAKEKYESWKKSKEEIRVGDEVIYNSRTRAVVLEPETEERYGTILTSKFCTVAVSHDDLEKTGRHFEEVEKLLKKWEES